MSAIDKTEMGEWLCAYLDDALSGDERALVEQLLNEHADARALLDVLRRTSQAVCDLPRHPAPDTILEDIRNQLERSELIGAEPEAMPQTTRGSSALSRWAMAAMLGFAAVGGIWAVVDRFGPNRTVQVASAPKAHDALEETAAKQSSKDAAPANLASKLKPRNKNRSQRLHERPSEQRHTRRRSSTQAEPAIATAADTSSTTPSTPQAIQAESVAAAAPLQPIDTPMLERLIRKDRKLGQAWPASAIRRHRFENETIHLSFNSPDEFARNRLARSLIGHLEAGEAVELNKRPRNATAAPFYIEGIAGINFDAPNARQILVRLPKVRAVQVLGGLLSDTSEPYTHVQLKIDSFHVDGRDGVVSLLSSLNPEPDAATKALATNAASNPPSTLEGATGGSARKLVGGMFAGLFRVIGVDPSMLPSAIPPAKKHEESGSPPTPAQAAAPPAADLVRTDAERSADSGKDQAEDTRQGVAANAVGKPTSATQDEDRRMSLVEKRLEAMKRPSPPMDADRKANRAKEATHALKKKPAKRLPPHVVAPREWITIVVELNVPEARPTKPAPPAKAPTAQPDAPKPGTQDEPSNTTKAKK
ncbi:MAG: hypothetical protein ACE5E5_12590 [Phycisphaerae bacterium]